jgi:hypothetical protein
MSPAPKIYLNGIDATTGQYLLAPMTVKRAVQFAKGENVEPDVSQWFEDFIRKLSSIHLGIGLGLEAETDLAQAGWGIVFHQSETDAVKKAFQPLIDLRTAQVGNKAKVKVLDYRPGERFKDWLGRNGVGTGLTNRNPRKVPFYLLIVGSPAQIPFAFGYLLDVDYYVGRIHMDTPDEYARYVKSVLDYETGSTVPNARKAAFFGTRHNLDRATQLSADQLVRPLANGEPAQGDQSAISGIAVEAGFESTLFWGPDAKKSVLKELFSPLAGQKPPAFLFSATHGMGMPAGSPDQTKIQGSLLCQDWTGFGTISPSHYFSAADLPSDARVHGMITFHFACYGGGTPADDRFIYGTGKKPKRIANQPFLAALPKALLSHPNGGALAVIGHVERAWGYSISTPEAGRQIGAFREAISGILAGLPVAFAVKGFNEKYATLSTDLLTTIDDIKRGEVISDEKVTNDWIERNDAEGYVVIGDPAVHLRESDLKTA